MVAPRVADVERPLVGRKRQPVGLLEVVGEKCKFAGSRRREVKGKNALEMQRAPAGLDAIRRVGEVDQAIGPADDVVGAVEPRAGPGFDQRSRTPLPSNAIRETRRPFCSQKTMQPPGPKVWPLAAPVCSRTNCDRAVGHQAIGPLGLDVLKKQRAVGMPERPFGELKPAGKPLDLADFRPASESPASLRIVAIMRSPDAT